MRWRSGPRERAIADSLAAFDAVERIRELQDDRTVRARVHGRFAREYRRVAGRLLGDNAGPPALRDVERGFAVMERARARSLLETLDAAGADAPASGAASPSIERIAERLNPGQALISYQIAGGDEGSWAIVAARGAVRAVALGPAGRLERQIELYLALLARRDGSEKRGARALARSLLEAPLAALPDGATRLVVIPDGPMWRLPLVELPCDPDGTPLAARFELTLVPSAATWLRFQRTGVAATERLVLALADPEPLPAAEPGGEALLALPFARREAQGLFRRLGKGGTVLVGGEATEAALRGAPLASYAVVHFATHAVVNDEHPERSALALAATAGDDGWLDFGEITGLPLQGQLVILTACHSGSGPIVGGEGVLGLANAFFQAGARSVVAGLWPLRDEETARLIDEFSRRLAEGATVSAAIAASRRASIASGAPAAAWAGVAVFGDGDLVVRAAEPPPRAVGPDELALAAALCAVAAAAIWWWRRDQRSRRW
jgi:CHAT domain-containing protein